MNRERSQFDEDLYFEILKSERLRVQGLAVILGASCLIFVAFDTVLPRDWNPFIRLFGDRVPTGAIAAIMGAACLYELFVHTLIGKGIARRFRIPEGAKYGNALAETSLPTIVLLVLSRTIPPEVVLNSPLVMVYFLFIAMSTMRLAAPLSLFTGIVAGVEFTAVAIYVMAGHPGPDTFFTSIWPIAAKSVIMVVAGAACAFVGAQIRRRLVASLDLLTEKNRVVGMFGQYISPAVVEQLLHQPVDARGEVRYVTIMFLDIRNFTTFAEHRTPAEVVDYLNTLFGALITIVNANHGIINKFLGDGFMACFGAPLSSREDARNAVRAGMEIGRAVERMSGDGTIPATRIGIGLHAGEAVTGSVGSEERKEYTIIGDTVNVASRVEQLTKQYGAVLLVTDAVYQAVKDEYVGKPLAPVAVKGREEPVAVYALL